MTKEECAAQAVAYKHGGYNCSQAVIKALSERYEIDEEEYDILLSAMCGFAGGMGCMESTCGALIGANMIVGRQTAGKGTILKARALVSAFRSACGATICKELKGIATGVVLCPCDDCVKNATIAAIELLEEN